MAAEQGSTQSKTWLVLIAVGILLMSFLGVMVGTRFVEWKHDRGMADRVELAKSGEASVLRPGQRLPDVDVVSVDGMSTGLLAFARDQNLIVLFVSVNCEPCTEAVQTWNASQEDYPGIRVVGVCDDDIEYARIYAQKTGFRFPLLCDTGRVFSEQYAMDIFPSVVGVGRGGTIAYVQHGIGEGFTLDDAVARLRDAR